MNKVIAMLRHGFVSSSGKTPEFIAFTRIFRSEFSKVLKGLGCTDLECHNGHFYVYGFFNAADGKTWYFNLGDVRGMWPENQLLVRTAEHRKDWRGGPNQYARLDSLAQELERITA